MIVFNVNIKVAVIMFRKSERGFSAKIIIHYFQFILEMRFLLCMN